MQNELHVISLELLFMWEDLLCVLISRNILELDQGWECLCCSLLCFSQLGRSAALILLCKRHSRVAAALHGVRVKERHKVKTVRAASTWWESETREKRRSCSVRWQLSCTFALAVKRGVHRVFLGCFLTSWGRRDQVSRWCHCLLNLTVVKKWSWFPGPSFANDCSPPENYGLCVFRRKMLIINNKFLKNNK